MSIEKHLKITNEKLKSPKGENKQSGLNLENLVFEHRVKLRQKLLLNHINLLTVVSFLPFAFGFAHYLSQKSTKSDPFFNKNLPALTILKPKLNFETFEYIYKSNTFNSHQKNFKEFLFKETYDKTFLFQQPKFIAKLKKSQSFGREDFNGVWYSFYNVPLTTCSNPTFFKNLDELPSYLEAFFQKNEKICKSNTSFLFSSKSDFFKQEKNINTRIDSPNREINFSSPNLVLFGPQTVHKNLTLISKVDKRPTSFSSINTERTDLSKNQLDINLTEKESSLLKKLRFLDGISAIEKPFLIDKTLEKLTNKKISTEVPEFRIMSGYKYPDMNVLQLNWFFIQKSLFKKSFSPGFTVEYSHLPVFSKKYNFTINKFPSALIETKKIVLKNLDQNRIIYTGPALILDSQKAFDWKEQVKSISSPEITGKQKSLRSWFHSYVSPYNPLVQLQENFFGISESPEFLLKHTNQNFFNFGTNSIFRLSYIDDKCSLDVPSQKSNFVPFTTSFSIPLESSEFSGDKTPLLSKEEQNFFIRGTNLNLSNEHELNTGGDFLPLVQLHSPQFTSLMKSSNLFASSTSLFETRLLENLDYTFPPICLNDSILSRKLDSGRYQKWVSVLSKTIKSRNFFIDNWEPLTTNSWLVVSQLSFAFVIFHLLKSVTENYTKELLGHLLNLVSALGVLDEELKQQIETLMGSREKGFKIILQSQKTFADIVGIKQLLPEIYEVVWFLRNSARDFTLSKTLPRGILLTGPPGTGKTLLVQALAGEAQVPVVVLSGSSLIEPGESGALKLEMMFQEARQVAPCIVFIDEIDTLAEKRSGVVQNPMGPDELLESLTSFEKTTTRSALDLKSYSGIKENNNITPKQSDVELENPIHHKSTQDQLSLLTQFLIELDGIQGRDGVIVIGATNRPEVIDPALLRPGRFDKIIPVGLPGHQKRVEILQFYGQTLGYESEIPWNYLGERTAGFTAADLATLMNESTIKAILNQSNHTVQTIEHGIDRLTTSESEKYAILKTTTNCKNFSTTAISSLLRLAYYQAGKMVLSDVLENHPTSFVVSLWPRRPTIRSLQITANLQNSVFQFARLGELYDRLIGCYAGKAAEFLFLEKMSFSYSSYSSGISTLGLDDLLFAQKLIYCLLEKWSFYSKKTKIQKTISLASNINAREFRENPEKLEFYTDYLKTIEMPPMTQALETQTSSLGSHKEEAIPNSNAQLYYSIPWWQQQISSELEFVEKNFANWSRLYLSNPEQNDRNPEWLPPDEFYHSSSGLKNAKIAFQNLAQRKNTKKAHKIRTNPSGTSSFQTTELNQTREFKNLAFTWNDIAKITRDYPAHSLVLQSFNKALVILNQRRELLDQIVIELLHREILRQPELEKLVKDFQNTQIPKTSAENRSPDVFLKEKSIHILESSWGQQSRKPFPRWIDFTKF